MIDALIEKIIEKQNPTCVGLDTSFDYLPDEMKEGIKDFSGVANAIFAFNKEIIDHIHDIVPAVKIQIAYYEMYGYCGLTAFLNTITYAKARGMVVIVDAKRNDIGATAGCYSKAYLGETDVNGTKLQAFHGDMLTVNGYLGTDGIQPFLDDMKKFDKGIFVLVKTSNPSGGELQDMMLADGRTVYELMGALVERWGAGSVGKYGYSDVGAVVGATYPTEAAKLRKQLSHTFFLVPGYGAQGGSADMIRNCFDANGLGAIVNNSRGILCAYKKNGGTYYEAARQAAIDMQKDLLAVIGPMGKKES